MTYDKEQPHWHRKKNLRQLKIWNIIRELLKKILLMQQSCSDLVDGLIYAAHFRQQADLTGPPLFLALLCSVLSSGLTTLSRPESVCGHVLRRSVRKFRRAVYPIFRHASRTGAHVTLMTTTQEISFSVGKYLVSPLTRLTESGHYAASVSIRSGRGSGTHDRVFRFSPHFATREGAVKFAIAEGQNWLQERHCPA